MPSVVGGFLRGQPELTLLAKAAMGLARLELVDERLALLSTILSIRPRAVVLPPFDVDKTSTVPLLLRIRREAPGVAVLLLANNPTGAGQPIVRAAQAGAHVVTAPTSDELRKALANLLGPQGSEQ